jgi:3-oxoacyl-[acyl-carrier protein] reductase
VVYAELLDLEKFRACIDSSLVTSALMVKHFCGQMKIRKDGQFVFLSSTAGLRGNALMPAYTAAKHAIIGLTRAYARELGPWGIRCNAVLPGLINSPMALDIQTQLAKRRNKDFVSTGLLLGASTGVPLGRIGEPQDVANAVHFLISKASSYCNGLMLNVDGGLLVK